MLSAADSELPPGGHLPCLGAPDRNVFDPGLLEFYFESEALLMFIISGDFNRFRPLMDPLWLGAADALPLTGAMMYSESGSACILAKPYMLLFLECFSALPSIEFLPLL